jgi:Xaa-Pro aminopeptidase
VTDAEVVRVGGKDGYSNAINALIDEYGFKTVGFEDGYVTYSEYNIWRSKLKARLVEAQNAMSSLRAVKSERELNALKRAQRISENAFRETLELVCGGMTERELAAELIYRLLKNGADDKSFDPIVVSGPRTSMPHGMPTDRKLERGFLTIDFGARKDGWCSDTTRTVCLGEPTDEMRRVYETVLSAQLAGIAAVRAGVSGAAVDAAARAVITEAGYGEYFGHGFGHGLGLEVHEEPNASESNTSPLQAGAVISAEPGVYIPGSFGVRIEDVLYVTEGGSENITRLPKELSVIPV